ncbi:hypothetical protein EFN18_09040 [Propionibacterium freudenreichii]|nr:hypothetical protein [Propionibacterium freudenreichii]
MKTIEDESDLNEEQRQALDDLVSYAVVIIEDEGGRTPSAHWRQDGRIVIDAITSTGGFDFAVEDDTITSPLRGVHPDLISEAIDDALPGEGVVKVS